MYPLRTEGSTTSRVSSLIACAGLLASVLSVSERTQAAGSGTVEKITVHGRALEGNLEGDSADRDVILNLKSLKALAFDVGTKDFLLNDSKSLDASLTAYEVPHTYDTYDGDHINGVANRLETNVFAFFSKQLQFE
jgi:hypothetical protein